MTKISGEGSTGPLDETISTHIIAPTELGGGHSAAQEYLVVEGLADVRTAPESAQAGFDVTRGVDPFSLSTRGRTLIAQMKTYNAVAGAVYDGTR